MANITTTVESWSTTAGSNQPDAGDSATVQADLQAVQAAVRREYASDTLASASTVNIGAAAGAYISISGVTTITAFDSSQAGVFRTLVFQGILTLTHNGTSLILPGGANITTAAGDVAVFRCEGSANWRCINYAKASGAAVVAGGSGSVIPSQNDGRLTLATGTPVTTTDQTGKTTVYWTPFLGKNISLYNGSSWETFSQAELSVSVPSNTNTPFDVFMNYNSGTPALVATAWTNDTTRATALTTQDNVLVKSGSTGQRYLGTGRTTSVSGQTEDSVSKRFLWNCYNRVTRHMKVVDTTDSWTWSGGAWHYANASSANIVSFVLGQSYDPVEAQVYASGYCTGGGTGIVAAGVGVGVDSSTANSALTFGINGNNTAAIHAVAKYYGYPAVGGHFLAWIEIAGSGSGGYTFYGDNAATYQQSGMTATIIG